MSCVTYGRKDGESRGDGWLVKVGEREKREKMDIHSDGSGGGGGQ